MKVCESKKEGLKRSYKIKIPAGEIQEKNSSKIAEMQKMAKLPGFRPGKVPQEYLEKRFGDSVTQETVNEFVNETSQKLVKDEDLRLATQPKIDVKKFAANEDLEYDFECEILPPYQELDYAKVKLTNYKIMLPSSEVDKQLELRASAQKTFAPAKDQAAKVKKGDAVKLNYKGSVDGEYFEGGTAENHELEIGSGSFIDNFEDQLVGLKVGDEKKVKVKFPKEYHAAHLQGKPAVFEVKINELLEVTKPKIDDEYAKSQGLKDVAELKSTTKDAMEKALNKQSREQFKKEFFDYVEEKVKMELPESMVDEEFKAMINQYLQENQFKDEDEAEEKDDKNFKKLKKDYVKISKRRVKSGILLSQIAHENNITVEEKELMDAMQQQFASYPGNPEDLMGYFKNNPSAWDYMKGPILEDKTIGFIFDKVSLKEKEVTMEQFKRIQAD